MSTLLEQASLVMIPSGYKEDTVYSVIPESGAGDLSLTRASDGTRINSAGLVENMPYNLLQYSQTITNGVWQTQNTTKSLEVGTTPLNTPIYKVLATGNFAQFYESNILTVGVVYSDTVLVKKGNCRYIHFRHGNFSYYDFDTNTFSGSNASLMTASDLTNGWILIKTSGYASTFANFSIYQSNNTNPYGGANGDFTYVSFCQVNLGSTAKQYFATTNRQDVPRLNYQNGGGGCPSLLLEPQRTNLALYSDQFNNGYWTPSGCIVTANFAISPDGTQNADKILPNVTSGGFVEMQYTASVTSGTTYTYSQYVKANGYNYIQFIGSSAGFGTFYINYDIVNGVETAFSQGTTVGTITRSIQSVGNGWFRVSASVPAQATGSYRIVLNIIPASNSIRGVAWTSDGVSSVLYYGAQLETGAYATSYIPTTSASATRVAEACFKTGITSLIGQTQGTIFYDGIFGTNSDELYLFMQKSGSTGINDSIYLQRFSATSQIYMNVYLGGSAQVYSGGGSLSVGDRFKIALAYANNDFVLYINGVQIATDTTGSVPTCANLQVGTYTGAPSNPIYMANKVNQVALFKTRLTNTELAQLTSL